jgi:pterin-4a-carbinolamine dehydratase
MNPFSLIYSKKQKNKQEKIKLKTFQLTLWKMNLQNILKETLKFKNYENNQFFTSDRNSVFTFC